MIRKKDKVLTGLAGEYYVLAQLAERGFTAALTLGNSKNVDIIVTSPNGKKITRLEVKTSSLPLRHEHLFGANKFYIWAMGEKHERIKDKNLAYCFVVLKGKGVLPSFFIVPSSYVARYVRWQHRFWLKSRKQKVKDTPMRNFRIEEGDPRGFQDNWRLLA
jgi:hypothetical protein